MKNIVCLSSFLVLFLVGILLSSTGNAQVGCDDETNALARLCAKYVLKDEIAKLISMEKVFYVAGTCGRRIPPTKKCGSIRIGSR
ncbi:hypothetical protein MKW92_037634 [Papaver armeniacum]|nr:hypothetical protein MKW92_037634 [Papaver armeniacum]